MATEEQPKGPLKTYRGSCHCGAYIYDATLPEITKGDECNCSLCYKKSVFWSFLETDGIKFLKGDPETLTNYTFGKKLFNHKFCPTCGISILLVGYPHGLDKEPEIGFNLRSLQYGQVDVWKLEINPFDGASIPPAYEPPKHRGPEPAAEIEGGKLYTGGCHCGAITVAFKSEPLDKTFNKPVTECNCSSCGRIGALWTYPLREQVVIDGEDKLGVYIFGETGAWGKTFCKTCGVFIHNQLQDLTEEKLAKMSELAKKWTIGAAHLKPINLKALNGINVKELNSNRADGYNSIPPRFVEPTP